MNRYQLLIGLLIAGMCFAFSLPVKGGFASTMVEMEQSDAPTAKQCLVLKAAAKAIQLSYPDLYDGFVRGSVTIADLPDDHYCVVYGQGADDFIILTLEEE